MILTFIMIFSVTMLFLLNLMYWCDNMDNLMYDEEKYEEITEAECK
jgi:hypothetical protein